MSLDLPLAFVPGNCPNKHWDGSHPDQQCFVDLADQAAAGAGDAYFTASHASALRSTATCCPCNGEGQLPHGHAHDRPGTTVPLA